MSRTPWMATALLLTAVSLAACGEKPQQLVPNKKDGAAFGGATNGDLAAGWQAGDKTSWEQQIRTRGQSQNEYQRTGGGR
jgi:predicted small lipoprotein YifL